MKTVKRPPILKAFDAWAKSSDGKEIVEYGVARGAYLIVCLKLAFISGWDAAKKVKRK